MASQLLKGTDRAGLVNMEVFFWPVNICLVSFFLTYTFGGNVPLSGQQFGNLSEIIFWLHCTVDVKTADLSLS